MRPLDLGIQIKGRITRQIMRDQQSLVQVFLKICFYRHIKLLNGQFRQKGGPPEEQVEGIAHVAAANSHHGPVC